MLLGQLIPIGLAAISLGAIQEADGPRSGQFWLRNDGSDSVAIISAYTSCGCTSVDYDRTAMVAPGDSTQVTLRFNPRGKEGDFNERATIVYGTSRQRLHLALTGTCIPSEESLLRKFPIEVSDRLRISADRFDLGVMAVGTTRQLNVVALHRDEADRQELLPIAFTADASLGKGLHHVDYPLNTTVAGRKVTLHITLDVLIK